MISKVIEKLYIEFFVIVLLEVMKLLEMLWKFVLVNIKGENGNLVLVDEKIKKVLMVEIIVVKFFVNIKVEDENVVEIKIKGLVKGYINVMMSYGMIIFEILEGIYIYILRRGMLLLYVLEKSVYFINNMG